MKFALLRDFALSQHAIGADGDNLCAFERQQWRAGVCSGLGRVVCQQVSQVWPGRQALQQRESHAHLADGVGLRD